MEARPALAPTSRQTASLRWPPFTATNRRPSASKQAGSAGAIQPTFTPVPIVSIEALDPDCRARDPAFAIKRHDLLPSLGVGDCLGVPAPTLPVDDVAEIGIHGQVPDLGLAILPSADKALAVGAECDG